MLVDMHLHECTYSTDSFLHLEEIVSIARQKGLDAICITDHDSMGLRERAEAYSREIGYSIFVGVEFFSLWGDITAWGIDGIPDQRVSAQDFIDLVREKDGFCVSCHPFRSNNRGLREHLRDVHGLDGVEVLNGSTPLEENRTALRFCRELGLKAIGASDAHVPEQVGKYVTWLPETVTTLPDFVTALHTLEKEQETTEKQNALDRAAAAVTASDAETLQAELDALLAVQQAGGTLTAPSDGTLVSLDLVVGQPSPAVGGQLAADADFTAEIPLEESQANLVSVGTVLHLSQSRASCDAAVQSLSAPDENGTVTAKCTLSKGAWCAGAANASATVQGEKRPCVLPASAVHKDNTGCYVLAIEQKATILGQQNIVVSLPVTVVETGDTTAAVSGALDADTQVIVSSTRAVQAGDRVKIHDAS